MYNRRHSTYSHFIFALCLALLPLSFVASAQQKRKVYDPTTDTYSIQDYDSIAEQHFAEDENLLVKINVLLINKDTATALDSLRFMQKRSAKTAASGAAAITLGNILWEKHDYVTAVENYKYGLNYDDSLHREKNDVLLHYRLNNTMNYNCCARLANYLIAHSQPTDALHFLEIAANFNPSRGDCVNGFISYQSELAPIFADAHAALHDTSKAIQVLLYYLTEGDSWHRDTLAKKFASIVHCRYTKRQIRKEIKRGIKKISFTNNDCEYCLFGNSKNRIQLNVFGSSLVKSTQNQERTLKEWKTYLRYYLGKRNLYKEMWGKTS